MNRNVHFQRGFVSLILAIILIAILIITTGVFMWQRHKGPDTGQLDNSSSQSEQKSTQEKLADPTEGGKYLVIKEWGVRFEMPVELKKEVSYLLGNVITDPSDNEVQAAKILIKNDPAANNECAAVKLEEGEFIDTAAQLLRVEKSQSFDSRRYKGTFKHNMMSDDTYNYHLNYVTPDCTGQTTHEKIKALQINLGHLLKV